MNNETKELLKQIADLHSVPQGAYNIRENGKLAGRKTSQHIDIVSKTTTSGIDIYVKDGTKNESLHIPVVITQGGLDDLVYNDFHIGDNCDILIVAGCGIHNNTNQKSSHDGIHTFKIGKNSKVKYVEKHLGLGKVTSQKILNPTTKIELGKNSTFEMETVQLKGVCFADRKTYASISEGGTLLISEKILTENQDVAKTYFEVKLNGENSKVEVISRAVAKDSSKQSFVSNVIGENKCFGHVECDGVISDNASIASTPSLEARCKDAELVHEAAIGKISEEQIVKLETLGLSREEAERKIVDGFLR